MLTNWYGKWKVGMVFALSTNRGGHWFFRKGEEAMFKKWLVAVALLVVVGLGALLPQKADAQIFPRVRARVYWGPPVVRYYDDRGYYDNGAYYRPYWGYYRWYPY
jgi:hypothetical protein